MKLLILLFLFSMAITFVFADGNYNYYDDDNDNEEYYDEETDVATTDKHVSLFDLLQGLQQLETPMMALKRAPKRKGGRRGSKSKVGSCWMNRSTYCQICNFKYKAKDRRRYVLCGGGGAVSGPNVYTG